VRLTPTLRPDKVRNSFGGKVKASIILFTLLLSGLHLRAQEPFCAFQVFVQDARGHKREGVELSVRSGPAVVWKGISRKDGTLICDVGGEETWVTASNRCSATSVLLDQSAIASRGQTRVHLMLNDCPERWVSGCWILLRAILPEGRPAVGATIHPADPRERSVTDAWGRVWTGAMPGDERTFRLRLDGYAEEEVAMKCEHDSSTTRRIQFKRR
jgi:hypothetical protein